MIRRYYTAIFVLLVVALPVTVFAVVKWYEARHTLLPVLGGTEHRIAPFNLENEKGEKVGLGDWRGKTVVAHYFFTHCPVVCPKMIRGMKEVQRMYVNTPDLLLRSLTVDPERDSAARLKQYASSMDIEGNWQLYTGDKRQLYRLARKSFLISATDGDGGPQDFIHSEMLVLIDKQQRIRGFYKGTDEAEVRLLIRDLARLQKENAD